MDDDRCAVGVGWCARADAMFDAEGLHVIDVHRGEQGLEITVETDPEPVGCPVCGVVVVGHGRRQVAAADAPCFGLSVRVLWRKRVWRCSESACPARTWSETHPLIAPRAALTRRAVAWATDALAHDDTTVSALARHLRVDWHTLWQAVRAEATAASPNPGGWSGWTPWGWTSTFGGPGTAVRTGRSPRWSI